MTLDDIRTHYPNASHAVELLEEFTSVEWHFTRIVADKMGMDYVVQNMKRIANQELAAKRIKNVAFFEKAVKEFDTEDFRTYLRGKLGMM